MRTDSNQETPESDKQAPSVGKASDVGSIGPHHVASKAAQCAMCKETHDLSIM